MKRRKEKKQKNQRERVAKREYHYQYGFLTNFVNGFCHSGFPKNLSVMLSIVILKMLSVFKLASYRSFFI
jgi:hypothetical protein